MNITKSADKDILIVDNEITFTVVVSNAANATNATNVTVKDILPAGMKFIRANASTGAYNSTTNIWTIGNLANGTSVTLTLVFNATKVGKFNNTVNVTCNESEWNYTNNNFTVPFEVVMINLTINKTAIENTPLNYVGDEITFLINVTNNAKLNATGVTVNDIIPDAFKFISSNASYDNNTGILNIGTLKPGESYVFNITVVALRNGTFTNIANVTCIENKTVKEDNVTVYVAPVVNLTVTKVVDVVNVTVGDGVVFTIVVTNNGPSNATNVTIRDVLPKGLTLVRGNLDQVIPLITSKGNYTFTIVAKTTGVGNFTNDVTVSCYENGTNMSANATVYVFALELVINKTVDNSSVLVNDLVNFTIVIKNIGKGNATNINIADELDSAFKLINATGSYAQTGNVVVWNVGNLTANASFVVSMLVRVTTNGTFVNVASVNCTQDTAVKNSTANVTAKYDVVLNVTKVVNNASVIVGDEVIFTITVTNNGKSNATNVTIKDVLPQGLTLVDGDLEQVISFLAANGGSYNFTVTARPDFEGNFTNNVTVYCYENSTIKSDNASVEAKIIVILDITKVVEPGDAIIGDEVVFTIVVTNNGPSNATNVIIKDSFPEGLTILEGDLDYVVPFIAAKGNYTFTIRAKTIGLGNFTNVVTVYCAENSTVKSANATVRVFNTDIKINKTADVHSVLVNDLVNFTIVIRNHGSAVATNVNISDVLDEGLEFVDANGSYSRNGQNIVWNVGNLTSEQSYSVWVLVKVLTNGTFTNVAHVNCTEEPTVQEDKDTVIAKYDVVLDITKVANVDAVLVGNDVIFTISVTNNGKSNATNVTIKDVLPQGLTLINGELEHVIPFLGAGETYLFTVTAKTTAGGNFTNIVSVYSNENATVKSANDTVEAYYIVNLDVIKFADSDDYGIGDTVTFTIVVTNNGLSNATNVTIRDALPDGLTLVEGELEHVIPFLAAGESYNFTVKAMTTDVGNYTNVVSVYCNENTTEVMDNATIPVYNPDLKIIKSTNVSSIIVGGLVNFTIVVTNHGIIGATGVVISDVLDTTAFSVVASSENYTIDANNLVWTVDRLDGNESYTVWIVVKTLTNGTFVNTATVNCTEEDTIKQSDVDVHVYHPDVSVIKVAIEEVVYSGNQTTFRIVVTNNGDMELTGLFIDEVIPNGLVYDHFIGTNWTNNGTMFYYGGSLAVGEDVELFVVVNTTQSGNFTNRVIVGSDAIENHTAEASIRVYTPDLVVRIISNNPNVIVGQPVSFTVIVTNDGDCVLGNVYVDNIFPEGLVYTGFVGENWTKVGNRFVYSGVLNPGESISYNLYFNTTTGGQFTPKVIAGSNLTSNATAKAKSNNTTVVSVPGIAVIKVADKASLKVGELVTFTITVRNTGNCALDGIFVIDEIPDGLEFVSFDGANWTKVGNKYTYSGSLAQNESASFTIVCNATKAANVTNVAIAGSNITGNVSASADVSIIEEIIPTPTPTPVTPEDENPVVHVPMDSKATGNPIIILLLIIFALIPLRRRKE